MSKLKSWKELPCGAIINDLKAVLENKTGTWRSFRPIWNKEKCINCLTCWIYCPDAAIILVDGKHQGINYDYCKGCGICAEVCPKKVQAITMVKEEK
ncbi:MAG: 4Fe-4S binding protein [candidate division WOR-3 bacterium]|nr:4Fe-4S binding protein [candidate division WOR-3 bacterium]MCX7757253.1 4Fe-4S binding protein [candidate division WOR-3 bacterium]MDW7987101.1 4Fe-4S binding protein [candidate division WOR-3 bacterium]